MAGVPSLEQFEKINVDITFSESYSSSRNTSLLSLFDKSSSVDGSKALLWAVSDRTLRREPMYNVRAHVAIGFCHLWA